MHDHIEQEFARLISWMEEHDRKNIPWELKQLQLSDVPPGYRRAFSFFKSLSGASREFLIDRAQGRRLNKTHLVNKGVSRTPLRPFNRLKARGGGG